MTIWEGKNGPYLIAEIGGNHEGDFQYAKKLTALACDSGVDAVKFQIYTGESLVSKVESPDRYLHFTKFQFSPDQYVELARLCEKKNTIFTASVWDIDAFSWIDPHIHFYKIGSGDLTAYPIIDRIVKIGKPIILSTGLATFDEVKATVNYIKNQSEIYQIPDNLALLQCTSMYPIPDEEANLNVMILFNEEFGVPVGYSDHTEGTLAVETAVAMGAQIIEFHFTDNRFGKSFRDHKVSFNPDEVKALIRKIDQIKRIQGMSIKEPTASEISNNHIQSFRRSIYAAEDLQPGCKLTEKNTVALRPCAGVDPRNYKKVLGRRTKKRVEKFGRITHEVLQN